MYNFFIWKFEDVIQPFEISFELLKWLYNILMAAYRISVIFGRKITYFDSNSCQNFCKSLHVVSDIKLIIINDEFANKTHDLFNFIFYLIFWSSNLISNFEKGQIKECPRVDFVIKYAQKFLFSIHQSLFMDFFMNNFFIDCLNFKRIDLFHFRSNVHRNNS